MSYQWLSESLKFVLVYLQRHVDNTFHHGKLNLVSLLQLWNLCLNLLHHRFQESKWLGCYMQAILVHLLWICRSYCSKQRAITAFVRGHVHQPSSDKLFRAFKWSTLITVDKIHHIYLYWFFNCIMSTFYSSGAARFHWRHWESDDPGPQKPRPGVVQSGAAEGDWGGAAGTEAVRGQTEGGGGAGHVFHPHNSPHHSMCLVRVVYVNSPPQHITGHVVH